MSSTETVHLLHFECVGIVISKYSRWEKFFKNLAALLITESQVRFADTGDVKDGNVYIYIYRLDMTETDCLQEPFPIRNNLQILVIETIDIEEVPTEIATVMVHGRTIVLPQRILHFPTLANNFAGSEAFFAHVAIENGRRAILVER